MSNNQIKCLCPECRDVQPTTAHVETVTKDRKGVKFNVEQTKLLCNVCQTELYDPATHDQNLENYVNAFRKATKK